MHGCINYAHGLQQLCSNDNDETERDNYQINKEIKIAIFLIDCMFLSCHVRVSECSFTNQVVVGLSPIAVT